MFVDVIMSRDLLISMCVQTESGVNLRSGAFAYKVIGKMRSDAWRKLARKCVHACGKGFILSEGALIMPSSHCIV